MCVHVLSAVRELRRFKGSRGSRAPVKVGNHLLILAGMNNVSCFAFLDSILTKGAIGNLDESVYLMRMFMYVGRTSHS